MCVHLCVCLHECVCVSVCCLELPRLRLKALQGQDRVAPLGQNKNLFFKNYFKFFGQLFFLPFLLQYFEVNNFEHNWVQLLQTAKSLFNKTSRKQKKLKNVLTNC